MYCIIHATQMPLPTSILWRRKEGFSDGVSSMNKPWYKFIQEYVDVQISDEEYKKVSSIFPIKEAYWYKKIFDQCFPTYQPEIFFFLL